MPRPRRSLRAFPLAMAVFCCVSGGPFGLEAMISSTGAGLGLLLILVVPLVWALPDALTTAELASAIPEEGGYVVWVRRAMGPFWSFLNGWWSWLYTLVDAAGYPVLFTTYLAKLVQTFGGGGALENDPWVRWAVSALVVVAFTALNVKGTRAVGHASTLFTFVIVGPFLALSLIGLVRAFGHPVHLDLSLRPPGGKLRESLSDGLSLAMWNYLGWDALSTIAAEVERPEKAYPKALFFGIPLVVLVYLLPILAGLAFLPDPSKWTEGSWPEIARAVGGEAMGIVVAAVGLVSATALFTASLLGSSRLPFVLAEEGFLPRTLVALHPRFGTPARALVLCGAVYLVLVFQRFQDLIKVNVVLYAVALILELASLLILRVKEPDLPRPFRVKGGWPMLALVFLLPTLTLVLFFVASLHDPDDRGDLALTSALIASGPLVYLAVRTYKALKVRTL